MRVLFLTHRLPYAPNRGDRIRAFHVLKTLAAARIDVDLLSLVHDREEQSHARELRNLVARVATAPVPRLANVVQGLLSLPTSRPVTHALLDSPDLLPAAARLMKEHRPDVVLSYCSGMARFALEAPLSEVPFVLDMVDVDSEKWQTLATTVHGPRRWIYAREGRCLADFEVTAAERAESTLVVNERERAVLAGRTTAAIHVVPNGVDVSTFRPSDPPASDPRVVFCGVMNYAPNVEAARWLASTVWPLVRRERPDARLALVGSDPTRAVMSLARTDPTIEVTGAVSDVRPYLWRAAVSVAPLSSARGIQNKVLEAVAAGLPVVVTPVVAEGLPREVECACVVADTADAFARALLDLLARPSAERRKRAACADLTRLGWPDQLAALPGILESAARR